MYQKAILSYDFSSETVNYAYDSIGFEIIYGLYNEYDDLADTWIDSKKSKDEIAKDIKNQLLNAIISWVDRMKPVFN